MQAFGQYTARIFLSLGFYLLVLISPGQSFITKIYTSVDGLPDSYINSIYQDSRGYLWVGTLTSLCRFDGKTFVNYGASIGKPAFSGGLFLEDSFHRYWIRSKNEVYLATGKELKKFPLSDNKNLEWIFGMKQMKDRGIWLLTDKGAYEFRDTVWQKIQLFRDNRDYACRQVIERPEGLYINFGFYIGIASAHKDPEIITPVETYYPYYVWLKEFNDCLYVNTVNGIFKIIHKKQVAIFEDQMNGVSSYDFMIDSKKRMWISTEEYGLIVSEPGNEKNLPYYVPELFNLTLLLTEDKEGNIWALNYEGLLKVKESFYKIYDQQQSQLVENIRHLMVKPGEGLLASSASKGLISFRNERFRPAPEYSFAANRLHNVVIDASVFDERKNLWFVTREGKLFMINEGRLKQVEPKIKNEYFTAVIFDSVTKTIYASTSARIYKGNAEKLDTIKTAVPLPSKSVSKLFISGNNLVIFSKNDGIFMLDKSMSFHNLNKYLLINLPINNFRFVNDPDGGFWINTINYGLQKFKWDQPDHPVKTAELTVKDGLPNNLVADACFDARGNLWAATLSGLVVVQRKQGGGANEYIVNRVDDEGMFQMKNWGEACLVTDQSGDVWLSSFHEIIRFEVDRLGFNTSIPRVQIESVLLDLKETDWKQWTDSLDGIQQRPVYVKLRHDQNTISISFNAITFSHSNNLIYSYKLEGLNNEWNETDKSRSVSYSNLAPGQYRFIVKAKKPNTDWSKEEYFTFIIKEPFWSTWWFQVLIIIAAAAILSFAFDKYLQRIKKKSAIQQQLQNLELKALKAQMNPHFIYNALNSIQSLIVDNRQTEAMKYIGKFAKLLRQVLEHSDNNHITLEKELSILELYIQLESLRLNTALHYEICVDDQIMPEKELIPPLIIQPYVENSLWHGLSRKAGEKRIWVTISATEEWLFIKIRDNGIGRKEALAHKNESGISVPSKGMAITAQRLVALNQQVAAETVSVIDLYDEKDFAQGTEVTLRIKRSTKA